MDIRKIITVICFAFSSNVFAEKASPILFDQVLHVKPNQRYEIPLDNVQPGDQIWTAVYLIGRQNYSGMTSKVDFFLDNQGLLNKAKASEHAIQQQLIAENLPQTNQYSFHQFKGLVSLIDEMSAMLIEDPVLEKTDTVRIYSQVNDWIPEYNSYEPTKVQFGIQNAVDFDIVAAYVLVGKGKKPSQLSELNFKNVQPAYIANSSVDSASSQLKMPAPPMAVPLGSEPTSSHYHLTRIEVKLMIILVVTAVSAIFAFINRRKFRRAF